LSAQREGGASPETKQVLSRVQVREITARAHHVACRVIRACRAAFVVKNKVVSRTTRMPRRPKERADTTQIYAKMRERYRRSCRGSCTAHRREGGARALQRSYGR